MMFDGPHANAPDRPYRFVTIMMPYYNSAPSLPRALASVLAQTFDEWECIVVDDGSTVSPAAIIAMANDPRIRLITLPQNCGRAVARQVALDHARGEFLAMLDADDWMYPGRLEAQVRALNSDKSVVLVSSAVAIVDKRNEITGVRGGSPTRKLIERREHSAGTWPPFVHAPSMIRMAAAKQHSYTARYTTSEDMDFILKVITNRPYALLGSIHYSYAESTTLTRDKMTSSQRHGRRIMTEHLKDAPFKAGKQILESYLKSAAYEVAFSLGMERHLVARRSVPPTPDDIASFQEARSAVDSMMYETFDCTRNADSDVMNS